MKTIHQLAKLARRIPRIEHRCLHKLSSGMKDKTTEAERMACRLKLRSLPAARRMLADELVRRNITSPGWRDARPLKVQRAAANEAYSNSIQPA